MNVPKILIRVVWTTQTRVCEGFVNRTSLRWAYHAQGVSISGDRNHDFSRMGMKTESNGDQRSLSEFIRWPNVLHELRKSSLLCNIKSFVNHGKIFDEKNGTCFQRRSVRTMPENIKGPNDREIENHLRRFRIAYKNGYTSIVAPCPTCKSLDEPGTQDNKGWSLFINKMTGRYICKKCGNSGAWYELKVGHVADKRNILENEVELSNIKSKEAKERPGPLEDVTKIFETAKCFTELSPMERESINESFDIKVLNTDTIRRFGVKFTNYEFLQKDGVLKSQKCLVIPWYDITDERIVAVKLIPFEKEFAPKIIPRRHAGSLFGTKCLSKKSDQIILTSSEFDALAVSQSTGLNAVSLPSGTSVLPLEVLPQLEQFEKIILWFGNDSRSKQSINQFSKKLDMERCSFVRLLEEGSPNGAMEALNKGLNLKSIIGKAQSLKHKEILTFSQLREDVLGEFLNADEASGIKWKRFPALTGILKGHRRGELTILTGQTGTGKTTLLSELSLDLCAQGVNTLWGSFEIKNVKLAKAMMCQYSGLNLETAISEYSYWADRFDNLPLYFMSYYGAQSIQTVLEEMGKELPTMSHGQNQAFTVRSTLAKLRTMSHAAYVYDIEHIIIDNLQFMMSAPASKFADRFSAMDLAIASLRNFASSTNVHVTLVIHPRKENQDTELQTASIFGTAKASQEADNIVILQDAPGRTSRRYIQVTKNRFDGALGKVPLQFNKDSLCMSGFFRDRKTGDSKFINANSSVNSTDS